MTESENRQATIDSRRIPLEREISIRVPAFDTFVTEYSANVSTSGMFIRSEKPLGPGTRFAFEFSVSDDWKLIRGRGTVVWTRYRDEGEERPAGMGVRFTEIDAQSRRLIRWIVEKHVREGGKPFELDELRSAVDDALEQMEEAERQVETRRQPPSARDGRGTARKRRAPAGKAEPGVLRRRLLHLVLSALAVVAAVGGLFWLSERGGRTLSPPEPAGALPQPAERPPDVPEEEGAAASEAAAPDREAPEPSPLAAARSREIGRMVTAWANAWSRRDAGAYLAHYSRGFRPGRGLDRASWAAERRRRVTEPRFIQVAITGLETELIAEDRARALFTQAYRSDATTETVRKRLELVWEEGGWKILEERVV